MHPNGPPPLFAPAGGTSGKKSRSSSSKKSKNLALPALNIDDVFGEIAFTPDGELEVKDGDNIKTSGEGRAVATMASRVTEDGEYQAVAPGGGLYTTQLHQGDKPSLAMGAAVDGAAHTSSTVPFRKAPQADHQLEYAAPKKDKKKSSKEKSEYVFHIISALDDC
jgi:hypothetical protein